RVISDLEQFYQFLGRAIDTKLPRRIMLLVEWDARESRTNYRDSNIIVGMNQPRAFSSQSFLLEESMREIARFGLFELSQGASRPDYEFLYEGMMEILVNEFRHTSRSLESAWAISKFLDSMGQLGFDFQRSWPEFSQNRRSFRNAAPGITFLMTFRELKGRESPNKFFETLRRANLSRSLQDAFDQDISDLEKIWLEAVREHRIPNENIISGEEAPQLLETILSPESVSAGEMLNLKFLFQLDAGVLLPDGVFVRDERTGKIYASEKDDKYISCTIPVEVGAESGPYRYLVTAIDESGNLRRWQGNYTVGDGN
ncbi:MAG: hypothetical protein P8Z37_09370, partial [Acidobacteriota bacterium]